MQEGDVLWGTDRQRDKRLERSQLRQLLGTVGLTLLIFLVTAKLVSLPVTLLGWYWESRGVTVTSTLTQLVNMAGYSVSLLVPLLALVLMLPTIPTAGARPPLFPLGRPRRGVFFPAMGVCLGVCSLSNYLSSWIMVQLRRSFPEAVPIYRADIPTQGAGMVLGLISIAVLPAVMEELLFRGVILQAVRPFGDGFAILVSALAFTLCHTTVPQLVPALLAGLLFGFFAVLSGSLWVTICIHCCYNLLAAAVELAGVTGGTQTQMSVSLTITAVSLLWCAVGSVMLLLLHILRRRRGPATERYRGALSLPERLLGLVSNIPLLIAAAALIWVTWGEVIKGVMAG